MEIHFYVVLEVAKIPGRKQMSLFAVIKIPSPFLASFNCQFLNKDHFWQEEGAVKVHQFLLQERFSRFFLKGKYLPTYFMYEL